MAKTHQDLVRLARLELEGATPEDICEELQISDRTRYRWMKSVDYIKVRDQIRGPVVSAEHPDVIAAREVLGKSALSVARQIEAAAEAGLSELLRRMGSPGMMDDRALIAGVKLMLDEHRLRTGGEAADDAEPLTVDELATARKLMGAA